jgi:hypothetical protein
VSKGGFGVGMPANILLDQWARSVEAAFDSTPYLVGSATRTHEWRDVDVRVILDDDVFERLFGKCRQPYRFNARWALICGAIALQAKAITGLPIDFQIQPRTEANKDDGARHALGLYAKNNDPTVEGVIERGE